MAAWLAQELVPLAWAWRLERRDGVVIGLTTHDSPLVIEDLMYRPTPGIRPSAIHQKTGLDGASFEIEGALCSAAISVEDLALGRWNGASLTLMVANWDDMQSAPVTIATGWIGNVRSDGATFTAELSGRETALDGPLLPETSPECRAILGDERCRVAMAARTHRARVVAVDEEGILFDRAWPDGDLAYGRLRWLTGNRRGLSTTIIAQAGARVVTASGKSLDIAEGLIAELTEGCDKRAATCASRFANIANFRGEPHLPGLDLLMRFPGG